MILVCLQRLSLLAKLRALKARHFPRASRLGYTIQKNAGKGENVGSATTSS
jgi:hypothetical protein